MKHDIDNLKYEWSRLKKFYRVYDAEIQTMVLFVLVFGAWLAYMGVQYGF